MQYKLTITYNQTKKPTVIKFLCVSEVSQIIKMNYIPRLRQTHIVLLSCLAISWYAANVCGNPINGKSKASAFYYLSNYGYIQGSKSENTAQLLTEDVLTKAIKDFQVKNFLVRIYDSIT